MKIAILTQPLRANYGGILQNYALQQTLIKLEHTPITLEKDPFLRISKLKLVLEFPKRLFTKYILKKRKYILYEKIYLTFNIIISIGKYFVFARMEGRPNAV